MALLDLPPTASLQRPGPEVERAPVPHPPHLRAILRRVGQNLLVACIVPAAFFYTLFVLTGIWPAILAALAWSYAAIAFRALTGRRTSGMLLLTATVLTVRTAIALAAHSTFVYFLQPVLTDVLVGSVFLCSVLVSRPVVARLAGDFYPLTDELHARPAIRSLFVRLTLVWSAALLAKALMVFTLLVSQPLGTFVLARGVVVPVTNGACIAFTILAAVAVARREGLLPSRVAATA